MYAYSKFHNNAITALVYPSDEKENKYSKEKFHDDDKKQCGILKLKVDYNINEWQKNIACFIEDEVLSEK